MIFHYIERNLVLYDKKLYDCLFEYANKKADPKTGEIILNYAEREMQQMEEKLIFISKNKLKKVLFLSRQIKELRKLYNFINDLKLYINMLF